MSTWRQSKGGYRMQLERHVCVLHYYLKFANTLVQTCNADEADKQQQQQQQRWCAATSSPDTLLPWLAHWLMNFTYSVNRLPLGPLTSVSGRSIVTVVESSWPERTRVCAVSRGILTNDTRVSCVLAAADRAVLGTEDGCAV
jgi:hypothetical protein